MIVTLTEAGTGLPLTIDQATHPVIHFGKRFDGVSTVTVNGPAGPQVLRVHEDIDSLRSLLRPKG